MVVVHKKGCLHRSVDALSRAEIAPVHCLLHVAHCLVQEDADEVPDDSSSGMSDMSEEERVQILEARDMFKLIC